MFFLLVSGKSCVYAQKQSGLRLGCTVYRDAAIRADDTAIGASDASGRLDHIAIVVPFVIDFSGMKRNALGRTRHDTKVAPLAALLVNDDSPLDRSTHKVCKFTKFLKVTHTRSGPLFISHFKYRNLFRDSKIKIFHYTIFRTDIGILRTVDRYKRRKWYRPKNARRSVPLSPVTQTGKNFLDGTKISP